VRPTTSQTGSKSHGGKGARGEVTQLLVREGGMAASWVDYKIASLDQTWSALRFTRRR
jgi:hypothetical protein